MRKKGKKNSRSLHRLLIREYLVFLVLVIAIAAGLFGDAVMLMVHGADSMGVSKLMSQKKLLEQEKYSEIRVGKSLGKNGYFEVLDEDAGVIYSSQASRQNTYTPELLQYVDDIGEGTYFDIQPYTDDSGQSGYVIYKYSEGSSGSTSLSVFSTDGDPVDNQGSLKGIIVLDSRKNIVFSNVPVFPGKLTRKEIRIIYNNAEDLTYMLKTSFTTASGQDRYLLVHMEGYRTREIMLRRGITTVLTGTFLALVFLLTIWFGWRISRTVNKPLILLKNAMQSYRKGTDRPGYQITYEGPAEFEEIVNVYNDLEKRLDESHRKQQELQEQKQKILADISHDLKTPITVIQAYATAIDEGLVQGEDQKRYLRTIRSRSDLVTDLVNQFAEYSNLDHPDFRLVRKEADICEYLREYLAEKYEELDLAGCTLQTDIPDRRILMCFDETQMRRVFENIITNSIRHNPPGTTIYAGLTETADEIRIVIGDDGKGIPEALRGSIFEPFTVGDKSRTSGKGSGLGLSIAKKIVELHSGTIILLPEEKGTAFAIVFPKESG